MPLEILGPLVIVGIAGIAVLLHVLGLTSPLKLESREAARTAWLREHPEDVIKNATLAANGRAALVQLGSGQLGLVSVMGADTCAHGLEGANWAYKNGRLTLRLPDFGAPKFTIALSPEEHASWAKLKDAT